VFVLTFECGEGWGEAGHLGCQKEFRGSCLQSATTAFAIIRASRGFNLFMCPVGERNLSSVEFSNPCKFLITDTLANFCSFWAGSISIIGGQFSLIFLAC
jgi:hypothetical protein